MKNNGMIEYRESIISKIKNIFKSAFRKNEANNYYVQNESTNEIKQENKEVQNTFIDDIKVNESLSNGVIERNKFLKEIDGNEEALNMLSIDRLRKLEGYYDSVIAENEKKIKKLKASA